MSSIRQIKQRARSSARRLRRRIPVSPKSRHLETDLAVASRELASVRKQLKRTKKVLASIRAASALGIVAVNGEVRPQVASVIERVRSEHLTYLREQSLRELATVVDAIENDGLEGQIIETGTARGGSAIVLATAKSPARPMRVYDVFGMIPPPTDRDGEDVHERYQKIVEGGARGVGGDIYYGYRDDLYSEVTESFGRMGVPTADHEVVLVRGLFEDTLQVDGPVALAHLDGDWYESTMTCLSRIAPKLVVGGRIVLDDYHAWSGCRQAVDEYFAGRPGYRFEMRSKLHVVRA